MKTLFSTMATIVMEKRFYQLGNLGFDCQCTPNFCDRQFQYLECYIPPASILPFTDVFRVKTIVDDDLFDYAQKHLEQEAVAYTVEAFAGVIYAATVSEVGTWFRLIKDEPEQSIGHYFIHRYEKTIAIVLPCTSADQCPERYMLRMIREIMLRWYENAGGCIFHASGVVSKQKAVLFCGYAGAGKTTLMTHFLETSKESQFLSNDRIIYLERPTPHVQAVPMSIRLGIGTLHNSSDVFSYVNKYTLTRSQMISVHAEKDVYFGSGEKIEMNPQEYMQALVTTPSQQADIGLIVFPRLLNDDTPLWHTILSEDEAYASLVASCCTPHDDAWKNPWILQRTISNSLLSKQAINVCSSLAATYKAIELGLGVRQQHWLTVKQVLCQIIEKEME